MRHAAAGWVIGVAVIVSLTGHGGWGHAGQRTRPATPEQVTEAVAWLEQEAHRIIRAARREMTDGTAAFPPQVGSGYEAFWLRDYEYTLEGASASYSDQELAAACRCFVRGMDPHGEGVDCMRFDGTAVFKPGNGTMGMHPVADGVPFTVGVAWHACRRTKDRALLGEVLGPLVKSMRAVPRNPRTGLVFIDPDVDWDRCPYGFTDTVRKRGDELFCSLLYVQAGRQLADLLDDGGRAAEAGEWRRESSRVAERIPEVLWDADVGLFRAATVTCREHDIWGSAFAVYLGVADGTRAQRVADYFASHYGELVQHGQIRHLPGGVFWEQACERGQYQNGAYWATPAGWFAFTLDLADPGLADRVIVDLAGDCREHGACEWIIDGRRHLPDYLASAALPVAGFRALLERRIQARIGEVP